MPFIALSLGLLSLIPFVWFGMGAVSANPDTATRSLIALIDYSALLLTFGGGVQWGLGLTPGVPRPWLRFAVGVAPMIVAWAALVLAQLVGGLFALVILMLGYLMAIVTEHRAKTIWLLPGRLLWLHWGISAVALAMMAIVLVLRGIGQTIVF